MLDSLFGRRRRSHPTTDALTLQLRQLSLQERIETAQLRRELRRQMMQTPEGLSALAEQLFGNGGGRGSKRHPVWSLPQHEDPLDVIERYLAMGDRVAEWQERYGGRGRSGSALERFFDSPTAQTIAANLTQILGAVATQQMQAGQFPGMAALAGPQQTELAPPATPPHGHPAQAASGAVLTPEQFLAELQAKTPEDAARYVVEMAGHHPDVATSVRGLLSVPVEQVPEGLRTLQDVPGWGPIARWLLAQPDWCRRFVIALHQLAGHQVEQPQANGHAAAPVSTNGSGYDM